MSTQPVKRILVVDDSTLQRARMTDLLVDAGYQVSEASDGELAVKALLADDQDPDLVITDLDMPKMNGFELLKWMKEKGLSSRIPVLVLTGAYDLAAIVDRLKGYEVSALQDKGGHPHHLLSRVNTLLFPEILERRRFDRVSVHIPTVFEFGGESYESIVTNVSLGGCFLVTNTFASAKERVKVHLKLPFDFQEIELDSEVVWIIGGDEWHGRKRSVQGMGVQWVDIPREDGLVLESFIEEKMREERLFDMLSP